VFTIEELIWSLLPDAAGERENGSHPPAPTRLQRIVSAHPGLSDQLEAGLMMRQWLLDREADIRSRLTRPASDLLRTE